MEDDERALLEELQDAPRTTVAEATEFDESDEQVVGGFATPATPRPGRVATGRGGSKEMAPAGMLKSAVSGLSAHLGTDAAAKRARVAHHQGCGDLNLWSGEA